MIPPGFVVDVDGAVSVSCPAGLAGAPGAVQAVKGLRPGLYLVSADAPVLLSTRSSEAFTGREFFTPDASTPILVKGRHLYLAAKGAGAAAVTVTPLIPLECCR